MRKKKNDLAQKKRLLMDDITKTRQAREIAYINFQNVSDPDLIDCYIYEINSVDLRYKYLINQIRKLSVTQTTN